VVGDASLLQPKIGISGYSIYVIEQSLLQSLLLVYHVYREFPTEGDISARQWPTPYSKGNRGFPAQSNITVLPLPSKSPDLNPIEQLCDHLIEAPPNANHHLNDWASSDKRCNMNDKGYHRSEQF
jgi:hypothetical protein